MADARVISAEFLNDGSGKKQMIFSGESTQEKPVKDFFATGSLFLEWDTGDTYYYSEESGAWAKVGG